MRLTIFLLIGLVLSVTNVTLTTCTCPQLQSSNDCTTNGCLWNSTSSTCSIQNCTSLTTTTCDPANTCALQKNSTCAAFAAPCSNYQGTTVTCPQKDSTCAASTTANTDGTFNCTTAPVTAAATKCSTLNATTCSSQTYCFLNNSTCADIGCSNLSSTNCTIGFLSATAQYFLCKYNGTACLDAPALTTGTTVTLSDLTAANCYTSTNQFAFTWSTKNSRCEQCGSVSTSTSNTTTPTNTTNTTTTPTTNSTSNSTNGTTSTPNATNTSTTDCQNAVQTKVIASGFMSSEDALNYATAFCFDLRLFASMASMLLLNI